MDHPGGCGVLDRCDRVSDFDRPRASGSSGCADRFGRRVCWVYARGSRPLGLRPCVRGAYAITAPARTPSIGSTGCSAVSVRRAGRIRGTSTICRRLALDPVMRSGFVGRGCRCAKRPPRHTEARFEDEDAGLGEKPGGVADLKRPNGSTASTTANAAEVHLVCDMDSSSQPRPMVIGRHGPGTGHLDCTLATTRILCLTSSACWKRSTLARDGESPPVLTAGRCARFLSSPDMPSATSLRFFLPTPLCDSLRSTRGLRRDGSYFYTIRLPPMAVLKRGRSRIGLTRPASGRPTRTKVKRIYGTSSIRRKSWDKATAGVIAKIEWHPGELFPKSVHSSPSMPMDPDWVGALLQPAWHRRGSTSSEGK